MAESEDIMKKYVFIEYRDSFGTGSEKIFDSEKDAVKYANDEWSKMCDSDKKTYLNDDCGEFRVYEIEITSEKFEQYNNEELELPITEFWKRDVIVFV